MQRAEIYLPTEKSKKKETAAAPTPTPKTKKSTQRLKALSPKVKKDETLEVRFYSKSFFGWLQFSITLYYLENF